jgi:hypothetical protein
VAWLGLAWHGMAGFGLAGRGLAGLDMAGPVAVRHGKAWDDSSTDGVRRGAPWLGETWHGKAR